MSVIMHSIIFIMSREIAVRTIADAAYYVTSYSEFELIIDIACALGSDHGQW